MNDGANAKQQIIEKIRSSTNILVTVSQNPSVDELSAALALTVFLNRLKKHATAVVSGNIPPAINFLDPKKTFENTVDSLRDFIIALDKEKADHLRYKVEGDVVKIFITPYRTTITDSDLDFSQGDYNVELVLALGVSNDESLDKALEAHGRILHDATVATLTAGDTKSSLGSIDWHDQNASSLSEMLVGLTEALKNDGAGLDEQTATALLTGIVAATDRFSNNRTSSRVMTMAAQLMAAGANQQLIAAKLEEAHEIGESAPRHDESTERHNNDGTTDMNEGESTKLEKEAEEAKAAQEAKDAEEAEAKQKDGELDISHEKSGNLEEVGRQVATENQSQAAATAEAKLAEQLGSSKSQNEATVQLSSPASPTLSVSDLQRDLQEVSRQVDESAAQAGEANNASPSTDSQSQSGPKISVPSSDMPPSMGGTLNATTEQAAEDSRREVERDQNRTILSHGQYLGDSQPMFETAMNSAASSKAEEPSIDPFAIKANESSNPGLPQAAPTVKLEAPVLSPAPQLNNQPPAPSAGQTLADLDQANRGHNSDTSEDDHHADARAAVDAALNSASEGLSFEESPAPQFNQNPTPPPVPDDAGLPPMPDFSTLPPLPPMPGEAPQLPELPSDPQSSIPPMPESPLPEPPQPQAPPQPTSPSQFRIPGQ